MTRDAADPFTELAPITAGEGPDSAPRDERPDAPTGAAFADWLWCGHRVYGYSSLFVWFDAAPEALARWFDGTLASLAAAPTEACPAPGPDWAIGVSGAVFSIYRYYDQPSSDAQVRAEELAIARALDAPFELVSWLVTESDMGGLDAWGRDRASLRDYLRVDATPAEREALRAWFRAEGTTEIPCARLDVDTALRALLPALGAEIAAPTLDDLRALAKSPARARLPRRVALTIARGADRDESASPLLGALDGAVSGVVRFCVGWL
jgi:hypothetical protein